MEKIKQFFSKAFIACGTFIYNIYEWIVNELKVDKILHITTSFMLCVIFAGIMSLIFDNLYVFTFMGLGISIIIGIIKEFLDKYIKKSIFDAEDIIFDIFGAIIGFIISLMFVM